MLSACTAGCLLTLMLLTPSHAQNQWSEVWDAVSKHPDLRGSSIGVCVMDGETGAPLFERNADLAFIPASSVKVLTTRMALTKLGPSWRFTTQLVAQGRIEGAALNGDLVVVASGDPSLGSQHFDARDFIGDWVAAVKQVGIERIQGDLVIDERHFWGSPLAGSTAIEDGGNYFGVGAHGFNAFDNEGTVWLTSGAKAGDPVVVVSLSETLKGVNLASQVVAADDHADRAFVHSRPYDWQPIVFGTIPKNQAQFPIRVAVPDPAKLVIEKLHAALIDAGIQLDGVARVERVRPSGGQPKNPQKIIHEHHSPDLSALVRETNWHSNNLFAAALFRQLGSEGYTYASANQWVNEAVKLAGVDATGLHLVDGSGLSRMNTATPRQLAFACTKLADSASDAALEIGLKPLKGYSNIKVKNGYLERVRAYSGRASLPDGRMLAFSIVVNHYSCAPSNARTQLLRFLSHIPKP